MADTTLRIPVPAVAAGTTTETVLGTIDGRSQVAAVRYHPVAAINGVNTNTRRLEVWNRGQAGAGTTVVASQQYNAGTNAVALSDNDIPVTTGGTPNAPAAVRGDTLTWRSIAVGTGLADPGGTVEVDINAYT
jgi:hypothetical protein